PPFPTQPPPRRTLRPAERQPSSPRRVAFFRFHPRILVVFQRRRVCCTFPMHLSGTAPCLDPRRSGSAARTAAGTPRSMASRSACPGTTRKPWRCSTASKGQETEAGEKGRQAHRHRRRGLRRLPRPGPENEVAEDLREPEGLPAILLRSRVQEHPG